MGGMCASSNCTSTAGPLMLITLPMFFVCHKSLLSSTAVLQSAAAPETISIISLVIAAWRTRFMVRRELVDQLSGVLGSGVRRSHTRSVLGGGGFQHRVKNLRGHITRHQVAEQTSGSWSKM